MRPDDPRAERGGRLHARVSGARSRHQLRQPKSDASVGSNHRRARRAAGDPLRQRAGVDEPAFSGVVYRAADRASAYPTGKADAERASRKFQRAVAGRVFELELVSESVRCACEDRGLAEGVQRRTSAQQSGIQNPERVCRSAGRRLLHSCARGKRLKRRPFPLALLYPGSTRTGSNWDLSYSYVNESWGQVKSAVLEAIPLACSNELAAVEFLEKQRWGNTPACVKCGSVEVYKMKDAKTGERNSRFLWRCRDCKEQYTIRIGTVYEESRLPLKHWV